MSKAGSRQPLIEGLRCDGDTQSRGCLGQCFQGGLRIPEKAKHQGLAEGGTSEGGGPLDKARGAGGLISGGSQNLAHGTGYLWYCRHWGDSSQGHYAVCGNHIMPQETP